MHFSQKGGAEVFVILLLIIFASLIVKLDPLSLFESGNNNPQTADTSSIANVAKYITNHLCQTDYPVGEHPECHQSTGNLFDRLVPNPIEIPPNIYSVAMRPSDEAHPKGRYGCTALVIDSYDIALDPKGTKGIGMSDAVGCIGAPGGMIDFFKNMKTHGYILKPFWNNGQYTDEQTLKIVKPGWAIFFTGSSICDATVRSITGQQFQHVGIVKGIKIDAHGNGAVDTYEADAGSPEGNYQISDWHFPTTSVGAFGGYNNTVAKVTIPSS